MDWTNAPSNNESPSFPYWGPEIMKKMPGWTTHLKKYETQNGLLYLQFAGGFFKDKKSFFQTTFPKPVIIEMDDHLEIFYDGLTDLRLVRLGMAPCEKSLHKKKRPFLKRVIFMDEEKIIPLFTGF